MQHKHILLLIFISFVIASCDRQQGRLNTTVKRIEPYISISAQPIKYFVQRYDFKEPDTAVLLRVIMRNNTNHILRYVSMTCSWEDLYFTDCKNFTAIGHPCDSNHGTVNVLLAGEYRVWELPVAIKNYQIKGILNFRLGFLYIKPNHMREGLLGLHDYIEVNRKTPGKAIWSNEIICKIDTLPNLSGNRKAGH